MWFNNIVIGLSNWLVKLNGKCSILDLKMLFFWHTDGSNKHFQFEVWIKEINKSIKNLYTLHIACNLHVKNMYFYWSYFLTICRFWIFWWKGVFECVSHRVVVVPHSSELADRVWLPSHTICRCSTSSYEWWVLMIIIKS